MAARQTRFLHYSHVQSHRVTRAWTPKEAGLIDNERGWVKVGAETREFARDPAWSDRAGGRIYAARPSRRQAEAPLPPLPELRAAMVAVR